MRAVILFFLLCFVSPALASPKVAVSIKPLHSLVASIMAGAGKPALIADTQTSLHEFQLKPSQRAALEEASLIIMMDPALERFMAFATTDRALAKKTIILSRTAGLTLLPVRSGGLWEKDARSHKVEPSAAALFAPEHATDFHLWLDPQNTAALIMEITHQLSTQSPDNRSVYERNSAVLLASLTSTSLADKKLLAPYHETAFMVFHDATQYFERTMGLHAAGSISLHADEPPSAHRLATIRKTLKRNHISCILTDPSTPIKLIAPLTEGLKVRSVAIDPEATTLPAGAELFATLMETLTDSYQSCLSNPDTSYIDKESPHAPPHP